MNTKLLCSLPVAALFFAVPSRVNAMGFTEFHSRSSFEAAIGTARFRTENFESLSTDEDFRNSSTSVGEITLSDNSGFRARIAKAPEVIPTLNINNTRIAQLSARSANGAEIAFDSPITAFGATFTAISNDGRDTRFVFGDGSNLAIPFRGSGGALVGDGFFGFVADSPIDSFRFRRFDGALADGFSIDDLIYGNAQTAVSPTPVPTPALLPGLIGMGVAAARKRKKARTNKE